MGQQPRLDRIADGKDLRGMGRLQATVDFQHAAVGQPSTRYEGEIGALADGDDYRVGLEQFAALGVYPLFIHLRGEDRPADVAAKPFDVGDFVGVGRRALDIDGRDPFCSIA